MALGDRAALGARSPRRALVAAGLLAALCGCAGQNAKPPVPARLAAQPFPIKDPLAATVVGTPPRLQARLPDNVALEAHTLAPLVRRATPPTLRYARRLRYVLAAQDHPAPLMFLIAGTGDTAVSAKCRLLARAIYAVGYSVACLASPTSPAFILNAARHPVTGRMPADVSALMRLLQAVRADAAGRAMITGTAIGGWSLGATEAAFVARRAQANGAFDFGRVLLLYPAVSVWASINRMDALLAANLGGGIAGAPAFIADTLDDLDTLYAGDAPLTFDADTLYAAYRSGTADRRQFGGAIALVFRFALANMAFAADVLADTGVVVPRGQILGAYASRAAAMRRAFSLSFADYVQRLLLPYWNRGPRQLTQRQLIAEDSLRSIASFLRAADNIDVFTSADDPILDADEVAFVRATFGARAHISRYGGHMGDLDSARVIRAIQRVLAR